MQTNHERPRPTETGYALMLVMLFLAIATIVFASMLRTASSESGITARNNTYNTTVAAAEAGTEMVIAQMDRDFIYQNVNSDLNTYRSLVPSQSDWPVQFEFSNGGGDVNETSVESLGPSVSTNLNSEFQGLYGFVSPYRVISHARPLNQRYNPTAGVSQEIQFASIPIFQFAIFYTIDLEINPGPVMRITGKVHSNGDIYSAPVSGLTFEDAVTAVGDIYHHRHANDPTGGGKVTPVYSDTHMEQVSALTLPVGPDNSPDSVRAIIDPPPSGENPNTTLGKERFYNKADLIIKTTDTGVQVMSGAWNNFAPVVADVTNGASPYSFVKTDTSLHDLRETKWTVMTEVNVGALTNWIANTNKGGGLNSLARSSMGHGINSVYVDDLRTQSGRLTAVRVVNGQYLPADGLTVATRLPLYVKGHFNAPTPGSTGTANTKPAALIGDAITILSDGWNDNNAGRSLSQRAAQNTTVNAALLGGIVKSIKVGNNRYYSGGVENFPRFLEDWSGDTLTYNGSMVVMFESRFATRYWIAPGTYYNAPIRRWTFDVNFLDSRRLPPMTPQFRKLVRGQWRVVAAN